MTSNRRGTVRWVLCFALVIAGCVRESAPPPATFAGEYALGDSELRLEEVARGEYRGTWRTGGAGYPVTAEAGGEDGEMLVGWVEMPSGRASLAASLRDETLYLGIELLSHRLPRREGSTPPGAETPVAVAPRPPPPERLETVDAKELLETVSGAAPEVESTSPASSGARLVTGRRVDGADLSGFRRELFERASNAERGPPFDAKGSHPAGFYFSYPSSWKLQTLQPATLSLTPPDVRMGAGGPAELFLLLGEPTRLGDPAEPAARELAERFIATEIPFVEPDRGPVIRLYGDRRAAVYSWSAQENDEVTHRVWLWLSIDDGILQGLLAILPADLVAARHAIAEDVFATFGASPPRGDRRLIGRWERHLLYNPGGFSMLIERHLVLEAGGRCLAGSRELNPRSGAGVDRKGTWRLAGKILHLEWSDGESASWSYSLLGDDLLCRGDPSPRLWRRVAPPGAKGD